MRILSNFNTNLDQEKIKEKSIVIKQYYFYLFTWDKILLYISFFVVLYFLWVYQQNILWNFYWTLFNVVSGVVILLWMIIQLRFIIFYIKHFQLYYDNKNKKILEEQDKKFDWALKVSFLLLFLNIVLTLVTSYLAIFTDIVKDKSWMDISIYILLNIGSVYLQWHIIKKALIDFEMDFYFIDGEVWEIWKISQSWFLNLQSQTSRFILISAVNSNSKGFLRSLFNFGYIDIVTTDSSPNIRMTYVKKPADIEHIIKLAQTKFNKENNID